jgi:hypothetical protein
MQDCPEVFDSRDVAIMRGCELIANAGARCHVGGFGEDDWNLDVKYDLSIILEQLATALAELRAGREGEIELYSQGVERVLVFTPQADRVRIKCTSGTSWQPDPAEELATRNDVISMLTRLAVHFARAVIEVDRDAAQVEPIASWLRGVV